MSIIINNSSNFNNNNSEIYSYEKLKQKLNHFFDNFFKIEITSTNKKNSLDFYNNNNNIQTLKNSSIKINKNENKFDEKIIKKNLFKNNLTTIENKENISNNNLNSNEIYKNSLIFNNIYNNYKKLFEWLKSIELECYFNLFIKNNLIEIDKIINNKKINNFYKINKFFLEKIGIKKIGHIFRILIKIEIDSKIISKEIKNILFEKHPILLKNGKEVYFLDELKENENNFCGFFNLINNNNNENLKKRKKFILDYWLKKNKIFHLKRNFIENGFEIFEYFIIQMFSNFPIDEKILKDEMNIKNSFEREIILIQLNKDVKYIKRRIENNKILNKNY